MTAGSSRVRPAGGAAATSAGKSLLVLSLFQEGHPEWRLADIASAVDLPRSTVHGLLRPLVDSGFLQQDARGGAYRLGVSALRLGYAARASVRLPGYVVSLLEEVVAGTGEIVYFAIPDRGRVLYLEALYPVPRRVPYSSVGRTAAMHSTGLGKAMLAAMDDSWVERILTHWGMPRLTPATITDLVHMREELARTRERGYAVDNEETEPGIRCVSVPVRSNGRLLGAVSLSGPAANFTGAAVEAFARTLARAAAEIGRQITAPPFVTPVCP